MTNPHSVKTQERILVAAVELFARLGYHGVSTREIARRAELNEVTVYRYYAHKRDLFVAAVESELAKVCIRPELLTELDAVDGVQTALQNVFCLIADVADAQPRLMRLLQFGALEFGDQLESVYRRHLEGLLASVDEYLEPWSRETQSSSISTRNSVLAFASALVGFHCFHPVFWGRTLPCAQTDGAAAEFRRILSAVLAPDVAKCRSQAGSVKLSLAEPGHCPAPIGDGSCPDSSEI